MTPNGLELSGPAKTPSEYRAAVAGSAPLACGLGRQRDWNEKAGSSETCFIVYDEPHLNALKGAKGGTGHV